MPARARLAGLRCVRRAPWKGISPASGLMSPDTIANSDVLPAPLGPDDADGVARPDLEGDVLRHHHLAELLGDAGQLKQWHRTSC